LFRLLLRFKGLNQRVHKS